MDPEPTCVYQYFDKSGALLYVGVTSRGLKRSHEHARQKDWWPLTVGCSIEHYPTRQAALARESYLIAAYKPPHNTQGKARKLSLDDLPVAEHAITIPQQLAMGQAFDRIAEAKGQGDYKAAIALWMKLPKKYKVVHGCVDCRQRPGLNGPMCKPCHTAYVGGDTLQMRRERVSARLPKAAGRKPLSPDSRPI